MALTSLPCHVRAKHRCGRHPPSGCREAPGRGVLTPACPIIGTKQHHWSQSAADGKPPERTFPACVSRRQTLDPAHYCPFWGMPASREASGHAHHFTTWVLPSLVTEAPAPPVCLTSFTLSSSTMLQEVVGPGDGHLPGGSAHFPPRSSQGQAGGPSRVQSPRAHVQPDFCPL